MNKFRKEHDLLGDMDVPFEAYYGIQTLRAKENFFITGVRLSQYPTLIIGLAQVKKAAALANHHVGDLSEDIKDGISQACDEIIDGELHSQFIVDPIQGGAGTSTNMNINEVVANRALEIMGHKKGEYKYCHPNTHVNMSQSTNDAYPTAFRIALYEKLHLLEDSMNILKKSYLNKSKEFHHIIKMGRTQLQDAVPMTLGQEFKTYYTMIKDDLKVLKDARNLVREMNLGGTAIGTGINSHPEYPSIVREYLQEITGRPFKTADDLVEATQNTGAFVQISGVLKRIAVRVSKVCNDLRLLSSGPRTGFNEINLPAVQPGSSIMPGKVNPVIPEVVNQVAFQVIGSDVTISMASEAGQLQLNVFEPIIVYNLFQSISMLCRAFETLAAKCIDGITANEDRCRELVLNSIGLVTALNPVLGYENSTLVAKEALETGNSVYAIVLDRELITKEELDDYLKPENMIRHR